MQITWTLFFMHWLGVYHASYMLYRLGVCTEWQN